MLHLIYLKHLAPLLLYCTGLLFFVLGILGRGQWAILLLVFLIPLRNINERVQDFPLGSQMIDILIAGALFGWVVSCISFKRKLFAHSILNKTAIILVIYTFISLLLGSNYLNGSFFPDISSDRVKDWKNFCLMPLLFFINLNYITEKKWIYRIFIVMVLTMLVMDYYTIIQIREYSSLISREKIKGTFQFLGPNEVAAFYNEYTIVLMGVFFFVKDRMVKWPLFIMICINVFCILFLYSRGAYMGMFAGMFLIALLKNKKLLVVLVLLGLFWQSILPAKVIERIKQTKNENGQLDESSQRRINIWEQSLELFQKNPLTGIGFGVFAYLGLDLEDTHNIYIKYLVEQGLIGFFIFLMVIFCFLRMGYVLYKKGEDDLSKGIGLGFMASIVTLIINNFFGNRWSYFELSAYLWILAGLVARLTLIAEIQKSTADTQQEVKTTAISFGQKQKRKLRYYDL